MNSSPRFQQNPAGIGQVMVVLPGRIYFSFAPPPLFRFPGMPDTEYTDMILGGQCFSLAGDFRQPYEMALAHGGVEACIQFYQAMRSVAGLQGSSPTDPWQMAALAVQHASIEVSSENRHHTVRPHSQTLAA